MVGVIGIWVCLVVILGCLKGMVVVKLVVLVGVCVCVLLLCVLLVLLSSWGWVGGVGEGGVVGIGWRC